MFIQTHYYITYITSFSDRIGEHGMLFAERQDRRFLTEIAQAYSMTCDYLVFLGTVENSEPEKVFFQGKEMSRCNSDDEITFLTVDLEDNRIKTLKENSDGFYLSTQNSRL